jgi:two-component system sensor histidine kinase MprB
MNLRRRITLLSTLAVGVAVALAAAVSYVSVHAGLRDGIDQALSAQAELLASAPARVQGFDPEQFPTPPRGGRSDYAQRIATDGTRQAGPRSSVKLPIDDRVRAVGAGNARRFFADVDVDGSHIRVLTFPLRNAAGPTGALQLGRSLDDTDATLARLRLILVVLCVLGVAVAGLFGLIISRRIVGPIRQLTQTAHVISRTQDLSRRIGLRSRDEVAELAAEFNTMLDVLQESRQALDRSVTAQRHLVADASHELRTPVTTLRANLELLEQAGELDPADRAALLADLRGQAQELGDLVTDVIELARGTEPAHAIEDVRLDHLVLQAVERARVHAPATEFRVHTEPTAVDGVPERLARAVNNLLDNATKYGGAQGLVDVVVDESGVTVRDHGPGIPPEDIEHVFDRFYRSITARGLPGTGLGLAIVKQVAEPHNGRVEATNPPGGGARMRLVLRGRGVEAIAGRGGEKRSIGAASLG